MKENVVKRSILEKTSLDQAKDTGMAMVLICLLISFFGNMYQFSGLSILLLLVNMVCPSIYKPVAKVWFGLSHVLGNVMSKVLLSMLFLVLVVPIGLVRKALGKDAMQLKKWKNGRDTVFLTRDHLYGNEDILYPY